MIHGNNYISDRYKVGFIADERHVNPTFIV